MLWPLSLSRILKMSPKNDQTAQEKVTKPPPPTTTKELKKKKNETRTKHPNLFDLTQKIIKK